MSRVRESLGRITSVVLVLLSLGLLAGLPPIRARLLASERSSYSLEVGRFLVARPLLRTGSFSRTVIVLLAHDRSGSTGLIFNRPPPPDADPPLRDGGPVDRKRIVGLIVGDPPPAGAHPVLPGLHRVDGETALELHRERPDRVRLFRGSAGWFRGQLSREIVRGGWDVLPGRASRIFEDDGEAIWRDELARSVELGVGGPRDAIERSSWAREGLEKNAERSGSREEPP